MLSSDIMSITAKPLMYLLQAHIWGLDQQLDKFTTDYVQQQLQRGAHGLLTISELDFAFPPNTSPAMVIKAKLNEHQNSSTSLAAVTLVGSARPQCGGGSRDNWLRMLQEPVPRLHNFPEVGATGHMQQRAALIRAWREQCAWAFLNFQLCVA